MRRLGVDGSNIGRDAIHGVFVFSAPGFEDFMRAESTPAGQKVTTLSKPEDARIQKEHARIQKEHAQAVVYSGP